MYPKTRTAIAYVGLGFALWLGVMGLFISFMPGAEVVWFSTAAILATLGLLAPSWRTRAVAGVLVVWLTWNAWNGYERGQQYREWLQQWKARNAAPNKE